MGFFDDLKKKAEELAADAAKMADEAKKTTDKALKGVGDITSNAIDSVSDIAGNIKDVAVEKTEQLYKSYEDGSLQESLSSTLSDTGDLAIKFGKTISGVAAYEARKESQELKKQADDILANTEKRIDEMRFLANNRMETFGMAKCEILKSTVGRFIKIVNQLKNSVKLKEYELSASLNLKEKEFEEMESVEMNASNALKTAAVSGWFATIAALGVKRAVTGIVFKLATASTGTAISSLSGAAATNATMAWLGGGSIAAGGGGVAAGTAILTTITVSATGIFALASAAVVATSFYSKKQTDAEEYLAQVKEWEAKTNGAIEIMKGIVRRSDELLTVSSRLEGRVVHALDELEMIVPDFSTDNPEHVKKFQKAAILTKSISDLAQAPLIDEDGNINQDTLILAESANKILNSSL